MGDVGLVTLDGATAAVVELHDNVLKHRENGIDVLARRVVVAVDDLGADESEPRLEAVLTGCDWILFELAALTCRAADRTSPGRVEVVEVLAQGSDRLRMLFKALKRKGGFELNVVTQLALDLECEHLLVERERLGVIGRERVELVRVGAAGKLVGEIDQDVRDRLFAVRREDAACLCRKDGLGGLVIFLCDECAGHEEARLVLPLGVWVLF